MKPILCVLLASLISSAAAKDIKPCRREELGTGNGEIRIHCSCMEQLIEFDRAIYMLTVNQTGCQSNMIRLDWNELQNYTQVQKVVFDHASIAFINYKEEPVRSSIKEVEFYDSELREITASSFSGLKSVEVLRFVEGKIGTIQSNAFSNLQLLKTIEFANTEVLHIKENAFWDLQSLEELAFINSNIFIIETDAIHLLDNNFSRIARCPSAVTRSRSIPNGIMDMFTGRSFSNGLMDMFTGRSLRHIQNVTFPEHGRKLIFFNSDVRLLKHRSIHTNAFSYIIFAGAEIDRVETLAFEIEFKNECDISAFLLIENKFNIIESEAFLGIIGQETEPYKAVLVLKENTFLMVDGKGFSVNPNLEISFIEDNKFSCSCENFPWILSNEYSEVQVSLEKSLVINGTCIGGYPLLDFLRGCVDDVTTTPEISPIPATERVTTGVDVTAETETTSTSMVTDMNIHFTSSPMVGGSSSGLKDNLFSVCISSTLFLMFNYFL